MIPRLQLFEWEDQPWFPSIIRDAGTAYLRQASELAGQGRPFVPILADLLGRTGHSRIIDLCSGGAGPLITIVDGLRSEGCDVDLVLTDLYPNVDAFEWLRERTPGGFEVHPEAVDARNVPPQLEGLRTLFNGFHHFRPEDACGILASAVRDRAPIAIVEYVPRHALVLISALLIPIIVALAVPFLRPFRWGWLPLTYLLPVIPLFVMWDGFVSALRNYSPAELEALAAEAGKEGYAWQVSQVELPGSPLPANVLLGWPTEGEV